MSILVFPRYVFDNDTEYHELRQLKAPDASPPLVFTADVMQRLGHNGDSRVYRANLFGDEGGPLDVVCKLGYGKQLGYGKRYINQILAEADFYLNELRNIQGKFVPRFRGLYAGETDDGYTLCLVLDYCGETLYAEFYVLTSDEKVAVISALLAVHSVGVEHGDFSERNVVMNAEDQVFMIDFGKAKKHKCELGVRVTLNAKRPLPEEVNCEELYDACIMADVWAPRLVQFCWFTVPVELTECQEDLASAAPDSLTWAEAMHEAAVTINALNKWWREREERDRSKRTILL